MHARTLFREFGGRDHRHAQPPLIFGFSQLAIHFMDILGIHHASPAYSYLRTDTHINFRYKTWPRCSPIFRQASLPPFLYVMSTDASFDNVPDQPTDTYTAPNARTVTIVVAVVVSIVFLIVLGIVFYAHRTGRFHESNRDDMFFPPSLRIASSAFNHTRWQSSRRNTPYLVDLLIL